MSFFFLIDWSTYSVVKLHSIYHVSLDILHMSRYDFTRKHEAILPYCITFFFFYIVYFTINTHTHAHIYMCLGGALWVSVLHLKQSSDHTITDIDPYSFIDNFKHMCNSLWNTHTHIFVCACVWTLRTKTNGDSQFHTWAQSSWPEYLMSTFIFIYIRRISHIEHFYPEIWHAIKLIYINTLYVLWIQAFSSKSFIWTKRAIK